MSEPDWKPELRELLDNLSGSYPDLRRLEPLRAVIMSLVEVQRTEAYKRGLMAERSRAGYRKSKNGEGVCPTCLSAIGATESNASAGEEP